MNKDGHFGTKEAVCLMMNAILTKILFTLPGSFTKFAGTAAWYMMIYSCCIALLFFCTLCILMKRFPRKNLVEIFDEVLGKFLGKLVSVIFFAYSIYYTGSTLREFLEIIKAYSLPSTMPSIILITFLAVCVLGVYLGLETIVRLSYIMFYFVAFGLTLMFILASSNYNLGFLKPFWGYGLRENLVRGFMRSSLFTEIIWLAVIINSLQGYKNFKKVGVITIILSGLMFSTAMFFYLTTFGFNSGQESVSGIFQLSRLIYINRFFQRVESIFLFDWVISSLLSISLSIYIATSIYSKAFKIKNYRPLIMPVVFLIYLVAMMPDGLSEVVFINLLFIRRYSLFLVFGVPLLVLIVSIIRRKKGEISIADDN